MRSSRYEDSLGAHSSGTCTRRRGLGPASVLNGHWRNEDVTGIEADESPVVVADYSSKTYEPAMDLLGSSSAAQQQATAKNEYSKFKCRSKSEHYLHQRFNAMG